MASHTLHSNINQFHLLFSPLLNKCPQEQIKALVSKLFLWKITCKSLFLFLIQRWESLPKPSKGKIQTKTLTTPIMIATIHMWLCKFKLIEMKLKLKSSALQFALAKFQVSASTCDQWQSLQRAQVQNISIIVESSVGQPSCKHRICESHYILNISGTLI